MALKIYDIQIDNFREPTQLDIDCYAATAMAYGKLRDAVARIQVELLADLDSAKQRHKPVIDLDSEKQGADDAAPG